jgi:Protein of unknown function (DUF3987)/Bifunctional DNA primase/polymerase, N-terminal
LRTGAFEMPLNSAQHAKKYTSRKFVVVPIPPNSKGPNTLGWNLPENAFSDPEKAYRYWERFPEVGMGLLHSESATCALDIDRLESARLAFTAIGLDLDAIVSANPYRIKGRRGEKPIYRLPDGENLKVVKLVWPSKEVNPKTGKPDRVTIFELRAGPVQDVLPPSIHPDTGEAYEWVSGPPAHRDDLPVLPPELLELWRNWEKLKPILEAACLWATKTQQQQKLKQTKTGQNPDVIGAYNAAYSVQQVLERNGYESVGEGRYRPPGSTHAPGVKILPATDGKPERVYSHHASDVLNHESGHDAFGTFCVLEHDGDMSSAVKAAAQILKVNGFSEEWPEPERITDSLAPVPNLEPSLLTQQLLAYCQDHARDLSVPLEFVAGPALGALGGFIGRRAGLRLKRHSEWTVYGNLYVTIIGPPSVAKTPSLEAAIRPAQRREAKARKAWDEQQTDAAAEKLVLERKLGELKSTTNKAHSHLTHEDRKLEIQEVLAKIAGLIKTEPRSIVNDVTDAKLLAILNENTIGVLFFRDELTGYLYQIERGEHFSKTLYLELWSGNANHTVDRKGDGSGPSTIRVEGGCLGIIGGIQPSKLKKFFMESYSQGSSDGFFARFLPVWPDSFGEYAFSDRYPDGEARKAMNDLYEWLETVDFTELGAIEYVDQFAEDDDAETKPPYFTLDGAAYELFKVFYTETMQRMKRDGFGDPEDEFTGKVGKQLGSITLILHLARIHSGEVKPGPVTVETLRMAIGWFEFFAAHWKKVMSLAKQVRPAAMLAKRIESGEVTDGMTVRDLTRKQWSGLSSNTLISEALDDLEGMNWLRIEVIEFDGPGRSSKVIRLNPSVSVSANQDNSEEITGAKRNVQAQTNLLEGAQTGTDKDRQKKVNANSSVSDSGISGKDQKKDEPEQQKSGTGKVYKLYFPPRRMNKPNRLG